VAVSLAIIVGECKMTWKPNIGSTGTLIDQPSSLVMVIVHLFDSLVLSTLIYVIAKEPFQIENELESYIVT